MTSGTAQMLRCVAILPPSARSAPRLAALRPPGAGALGGTRAQGHPGGKIRVGFNALVPPLCSSTQSACPKWEKIIGKKFRKSSCRILTDRTVVALDRCDLRAELRDRGRPSEKLKKIDALRARTASAGWCRQQQNQREVAMQFRKRPVTISAAYFDGELVGVPNDTGRKVIPRSCPDWLPAVVPEVDADAAQSLKPGEVGHFRDQLFIGTLDAVAVASAGDWIICGVHGELYPCKPRIFFETYEPVDTVAKMALSTVLFPKMEAADADKQ